MRQEISKAFDLPSFHILSRSVLIDFPKNIQLPTEILTYNRTLATRFNIKGFPTVQLLNPDGSPIAQTGFQYGGPEKYIEHLKELLIKE